MADLNTAIPVGTGNFTGLTFGMRGIQSISGGSVVFNGEGSSGQQGAYLFNGITLNRVADLNTPIPDGSQNFVGVGFPAISGHYVAFGGGDSSGQMGIYLFNGSTLSKVADTNSPIPDGTGNFTNFSFPGISGENIAVWGSGASGQVGIYLASLQSPQAVSAPTVTQWGMVIMSALFGGSGVCLLRRKRVI